MRFIPAFILLILLLSACEKQMQLEVPIDEILEGPGEVKPQAPKVEPVGVVAPPINTTPIIIEEKKVEALPRGSVINIDVLIRSKSSTINVMFENGEEKFNLENTEKGLIVGILVGKYNLTEQKIRSLTTFLEEAAAPIVNASTTVQPEAQPAPTQTKVVEIKAYSFVPEVLTVQKGTAVVWTHKDLAPHTVTATTSVNYFSSNELKRDDTFTHVFSTQGTYDYYCTYHPSMRGKIVVQ